MISPQTIQQISSRIDIIDVIGEFVRLKKRGANYLGLCPFHGEKTPSFTVSPAKEIYKCFGCGKSGNTITFLMELEKYSYVEALRWLANRYNVEIEETEVSGEVKQQQMVAESLHIINAFAQQFFIQQLFDSEEGRTNALSYLEERGFTEEVMRKFQLGYNPKSRDAFTKAALANQFNADLLLKTGLVSNRNDELADNYRGRIIFPVHNNTGKIIGFGARVIGSAEKAPKYINTPENEIYVKSKILYGSYFARQAINNNKECLLVEGYTDVISLHQAGIENVVASGGTSLTTNQLRLIKKFTNNLTIIYDGDAAGVKAALRGLDLALEESLDVKLVLIPDNEDPDSYVRKNGAAAFREFIKENKKDFILFQLEVLLKEAGDDISRKNTVVNTIAETISKITSPKDISKKQDYTRISAARLKVNEVDFSDLVRRYTHEDYLKRNKPFPVDEKKMFDEELKKPLESNRTDNITSLMDSNLQEREVVKRLIEYGFLNWDETTKNYSLISEVLDLYHITDPRLDKIVSNYFNALNEFDGLIDPKDFIYLHSEDENFTKFISGLLYFPFELHNWDSIDYRFKKLDDDIKDVINSALTYYKIRKIKLMYAEVEDDIQKEIDFEKNKLNQTVYLKLKEEELKIVDGLGMVIIK